MRTKVLVGALALGMAGCVEDYTPPSASSPACATARTCTRNGAIHACCDDFTCGYLITRPGEVNRWYDCFGFDCDQFTIDRAAQDCDT